MLLQICLILFSETRLELVSKMAYYLKGAVVASRVPGKGEEKKKENCLALF